MSGFSYGNVVSMWSILRMAWVQAVRRRGRTMAVISAIVVASMSFAILSSAVATSRLRVQGTVSDNFRTAYDILVRPATAETPLEKSDQLVQENYLSGIYGGISLKQYHQIQAIPGVQVAAPIAMIGYTLPAVTFGIGVNSRLDHARDQLYVAKRHWQTDRGLTHVPDRSTYIYYTRRPVQWHIHSVAGLAPPVMTDPSDGKHIRVCQAFLAHMAQRPPRSAFDVSRYTELSCAGSNPAEPGRGFGHFPHGNIGFLVGYQFPMLIAAIDPVQEARLVGLNEAVVAGRYLTSADRTRNVHSLQQVPVLMAKRPLTDDTQVIQIQRLRFGDPAQLPDRLAARNAPSWLQSLPTRTVQTVRISDRKIYHQLLATYAKTKPESQVNYWTTNQVSYRRDASGHLHPSATAHAAPSTFYDRLLGRFHAPQVGADRAFRKLYPHAGSNFFTATGAYASPTLHQVGIFDARKIRGFSRLSRVPLTTYYPPDAAPGSARTKALLHGQNLQPNANLAGYLQQPPTMLTTIRSLPIFTSHSAFNGVSTREAKAPISVIRVRVAGVNGTDARSRARVRLAAERIARQTGLTVDITIGSSPTPEQVDLPAGSFGRPPLTLTEGWVKKGVTVQLLTAVDHKSLALFGLVLLVCALFLLNATLAAVRIRRSELGVLACLGWAPGQIFYMLEAELVVVGIVSGLIGTILAAAVTAAFHLGVPGWHLALIAPIATLLSGVAGVAPAWSASHATPVEAIQPAVRPPRRASNVTSIAQLARVSVQRWPGRTVLGAASLFVGVAALAVLVAIQQAFKGDVTGTALGDFVAIQVRGVDYVAAALTIVLGAFAVADITYLNMSERVAEIGTLRATGWRERHIKTLFGIEALLTAAGGSLSGAIFGVAITAAVLPVALTITLWSAMAAAAIGILAAMLAVAAPLSRLRSLAPATAIAAE